MEFNVLSLNCWGVPYPFSKDKKQRFEAIAALINEGHYDFVFLQEIFSRKEYALVRKLTSTVMPYAHYFYSGVQGSGVCTLSKGRIISVNSARYSLNGYLHKYLHGDWFAGKLVGLCRVEHNGMVVNLYNTHLIAEYNINKDEYLSHRVAQSFELSEFVNATSKDCDVIIMAGDLNCRSVDIPYKILRYNSNLLDSFVERSNNKNQNEYFGATSMHARNSYTSSSERKSWPNGQRIDYIFYGYRQGLGVRCDYYDTPYDKIPGTTKSYSDHEAVVSKLIVTESNQGQPEPNYKMASDSLGEARHIMNAKLKRQKFERAFFTSILIIFLSVICFSYVSEFIFNQPKWVKYIWGSVNTYMILLSAFSVGMLTIVKPTEKNNILSVLGALDLNIEDINIVMSKQHK